jgi:Holliday junction DNA helicase RuvA
MINHIRGTVEKKSLDSVILESGGLGYEILVSLSTAEKLPSPGREAKLYIVESTAMYSGGTTLYGFLSDEERDIYLLLKDNISGAGAKKSLDYFDKISKSLPDFKTAIVNRDMGLLTGVFGFSKKTAEKIVAGLKDKIAQIEVSGREKWTSRQATSVQSQAVSALVSLGYKESQAMEAVEKVASSSKDGLKIQEIIGLALKQM